MSHIVKKRPWTRQHKQKKVDDALFVLPLAEGLMTSRAGIHLKWNNGTVNTSRMSLSNQAQTRISNFKCMNQITITDRVDRCSRSERSAGYLMRNRIVYADMRTETESGIGTLLRCDSPARRQNNLLPIHSTIWRVSTVVIEGETDWGPTEENGQFKLYSKLSTLTKSK